MSHPFSHSDLGFNTGTGTPAEDLPGFYIDYVSGDDSNPGTKAEPWKTHPYMLGSGVSYSHTAGDHFYFKGGVTWPVECFQMRIVFGGNSGAHDYYGYDPDWFTGSSFTRPVFDFEDTQVDDYASASTFYHSAGVLVDGYATSREIQYVTMDGIELARYRAPQGGPGFGANAITLRGYVNHFTLNDCLVRDWDVDTITAEGQDAGNSGGIAQVDPLTSISGSVISDCEFTQSGAAQKIGVAIHGFFTVTGCEIHHVSNAFLGSGTITHNHIHDVVDATDTSTHENAIYTITPSVVAYNHVHDSVTGGIYASPGLAYTGAGSFDVSTGDALDWIYNNVVYSIGSMAPIEIDEEGTHPERVGSCVWNNSLEHGGGTCIRCGVKATLGYFEARNNHLISSEGTSAALTYNNSFLTTPAVLSNQLTQSGTVATGQGYTSGNLFAAAGDTVDAGTDLSARFTDDYAGVTRVAPWDIGAHEST